MLIAEELEVDLKQVRLEHAPPNEKLYVNGDGQLERDTWGVAAAAPRRCGGANDARVGCGEAVECRPCVLPPQGEVLHIPTGRTLKYGELAAEASRLPVSAAGTLGSRTERQGGALPASDVSASQGRESQP